MILNMHCRLSCPTNDSTCSSLFLTHFDHTNTLKHRTCSPSFYHDQIPPSSVLQRRRRLEDPVLTHASNYYITTPRQTSHSPPPTSPLLSSRQLHQQLKDKTIYCDLFNLLERPPPIKQRKKHILNDSNSYRGHRSIVYKNIHAKIKDINERKRHQHHHQQQPSYYKGKKHQKEKLLSIHQFDQLQEKTINNQCIYQPHLASKGFFRRVVRHYFCVPMTVANEEFTN